ncbi:MAG: hypothetical protein IJZ73_00655 [Clostridia bacterium]|nr:hypothetical protein [Clostridia bacterium]
MIHFSDVHETLEEREERLGVKLDRYGLTLEESKYFKKDVRKEKLKKKMPFLIVLVSAIIIGGLLSFAQFLLPDLMLKYAGTEVAPIIQDLESFRVGNIPPEAVVVFMFVVAGFAWIGLLALILKRKFYKFGCKIVEGKGDKTPKYSVLPFMRPYDKDHDLYHKFFMRCPVCGHELKVIDSYNNNGRVVKKSDRFSVYSGSIRTSLVGANPREEHTEYECTHCHFKFKSSYKAEYYFKSLIDNELTTKSADVYVKQTWHTVPTSVVPQMDKEAEQILAEFKSNSYKVQPEIWVEHSAKKLDNWELGYED